MLKNKVSAKRMAVILKVSVREETEGRRSESGPAEQRTTIDTR